MLEMDLNPNVLQLFFLLYIRIKMATASLRVRKIDSLTSVRALEQSKEDGDGPSVCIVTLMK